MPSKIPFIFFESMLVAPIVCVECGNNAYCVRREPKGQKELQTFRCAQCQLEFTELRGEDVSDEEIQKQAERLSGPRSKETDRNVDE